MNHLEQRYVQYVSRTYRRGGTLCEGVPRSCLTQPEKHVLACYRFSKLDPVRAGWRNRLGNGTANNAAQEELL